MAPRVLRIAPASTPEPASQPVPDGSAEVEQAEPEKVDDRPVGFPKLSEITFENDVAQLPMALLTLDTPLQKFIPNKRKAPPPPPFPFLDLPSELRIKIYGYYFSDVDPVLDLDPTNYKRYHKLLGFVRVCKQIHTEATFLFYSTHSFRVFPTHPARLKTKKPILARLKPPQRACLSTLDICFGPGWNAPPRSWVVDSTLGLKDCINVTQLNVFVQFDPSEKFWKSFRRSDGFYENFSRRLLTQVLEAVPSVRVIQFDGWPSVKKSGAMMRNFLEATQDMNLEIRWGPESGWTDTLDDSDRLDTTRDDMLEVVPHSPSSLAAANLLVMA
jgi:hypothetical protein